MKPTIDFFTEKLGFNVDNAIGKEPRFAMVSKDDITIMLACKPIFPWPHKGWAVYIWVDDVEALSAEFKARQLALKCGPAVKEYGCKEVEVLMPDGRAVVFGQVIS